MLHCYSIFRQLSIDEEAEDFMEENASKLPDLIKEIITNKGSRGKETKESVKEVMDNNVEDAGMVKKRITLFENKFW